MVSIKLGSTFYYLGDLSTLTTRRASHHYKSVFRASLFDPHIRHAKKSGCIEFATFSLDNFARWGDVSQVLKYHLNTKKSQLASQLLKVNFLIDNSSGASD